jgi:lipopolysaccharide transport system ATP-binding protein
MSVVVRVENVSKKYQLGKIGTQSMKGDFQRWWARKSGKEDPFARIGEEESGRSSDFWALKDISFDIRQGEAIGIIGKNGAGKSTLLKILSRITLPTTGRLRVKGRIASLLEVGTGFNPDLSGRENIYLNGAILGMTKREVAQKFDEIVDFSGVERFIDTPVKRYSSGMYVRLAFAVAAHLESEILILDEVLSVGDAEFQKKCLGKMDDVARKEGRTVIFVSHDLTAVNKLCQKAVLLKKGRVEFEGRTEKAIEEYLVTGTTSMNHELIWEDVKSAPGNEEAKFHSIRVLKRDKSPARQVYLEEPVLIEVYYWCLKPETPLNISISVYSEKEEYVFASASITDQEWYRRPHPVGLFKSMCEIPADFFNEGIYKLTVLLIGPNNQLVNQQDKLIAFEMIDLGKERGDYYGYWGGVVRPKLSWKTNRIQNSILA